jgi:hypothetical protein
MRRRDFVAFLGGVATWVTTARPQKPRLTIGVLGSSAWMRCWSRRYGNSPEWRRSSTGQQFSAYAARASTTSALASPILLRHRKTGGGRASSDADAPIAPSLLAFSPILYAGPGCSRRPMLARRHLERTIRNARSDLYVTTDRRGRPYSLVCTKNQTSYDRRAKQRSRDLADLEQFEEG